MWYLQLQTGSLNSGSEEMNSENEIKGTENSMYFCESAAACAVKQL